jgi:hypothetical protein
MWRLVHRNDLEDFAVDALDISALARHLYETEGTKAIAQAAQKAALYESANDVEQAKTWRRVEAVLLELQGPSES